MDFDVATKAQDNADKAFLDNKLLHNNQCGRSAAGARKN